MSIDIGFEGTKVFFKLIYEYASKIKEFRVYLANGVKQAPENYKKINDSAPVINGFTPSNSTEAALGRQVHAKFLKLQTKTLASLKSNATCPEPSTITTPIPKFKLELIESKKTSFVSSAVSYAKGAVQSMKQIPGKVQANVITPLTTAVKEAAKNPMTAGYAGSIVGGALMVGSAVKAAINGKSQGIKKQLPTLAAGLTGAVVTGLSQIAASTPGERIALGVSALAAGVISGVAVAIASRKAPAKV